MLVKLRVPQSRSLARWSCLITSAACRQLYSQHTSPVNRIACRMLIAPSLGGDVALVAWQDLGAFSAYSLELFSRSWCVPVPGSHWAQEFVSVGRIHSPLGQWVSQRGGPRVNANCERACCYARCRHCLSARSTGVELPRFPSALIQFHESAPLLGRVQ